MSTSAIDEPRRGMHSYIEILLVYITGNAGMREYHNEIASTTNYFTEHCMR
jgi:hypothetical protein